MSGDNEPKKRRNDPKIALRLFWYYFRISWYTFGGGWSIVAQMQKDFVERGDISEEDLLDIVSLARSLPGLMITNLSYMYGFMKGGVIAGILSVVGILTPPIVVLTIITYGYNALSGNEYAVYALTGVRACVAPIILTAVLRLQKGAFISPVYVAIGIAAFVLNHFFHVSCFLTVVMGVVLGLILNAKKEAP